MGIFNKPKKEEEKKVVVAKDDAVKVDSKAETKVVAEKKVVKENKAVGSNAYKALIKPLVTEKATHLGAINQYVFSVDPKVNKIEINKAILALYGVEPTSINIIRVKGKKVRSGRTRGQRKDWKKAVVTLKKDDKIEVYEGV
jgi:large subunit ribosomal protein L23